MSDFFSPPLRLGPSGPLVDAAIETNELDNRSIVPGATVTDALTVVYRRRVEYLDLLDDPLALWNFNDTLAAVRGPSLVLEAGSIGFTDMYPGIRGMEIAIGCRLAAALTPSLQLLGDMSVEMLVQLDTNPSSQWCCGVSGPSGVVTANNVSWGLVLPNTTAPRGLQGVWQNGTGTDRGFSTATTNGSVSIPPVHNVLSLGYSRSGVIGIPYVNGRPFGPPVNGTALAAGGTAGVFTIGARPGAVATDQFIALSIAVYNRVRSASEWRQSFNRSIGNGVGFSP